jgi:hypothetical protein
MASAKRLIEVRHCCRSRQEDGRDQRARVADADPPDEVDDVEAPAHGDVGPPQPDALEEEAGHGEEQQHQEREADREADEPAHGRPALEDDAADLVGDAAEVVAGLDEVLAGRDGMRVLGQPAGVRPRGHG